MFKPFAFLITLLFSIGSQASLIKYELDLGPNSLDSDGGKAVFYWDDTAELMSDFTWDFGAGEIGGVLTTFDFTRHSGFLFELLTQESIGATGNCAAVDVDCRFNFVKGWKAYGSPDFIQFWVDSDNNRRYSTVVNEQLSTYGIFSARALPATSVPEPGSIFLMALGLVGLLIKTRKNQYKAI